MFKKKKSYLRKLAKAKQQYNIAEIDRLSKLLWVLTISEIQTAFSK